MATIYDLDSRPKAVGAHEPREYKREEIESMLDGYFKVPQDYWDHLPKNGHIRFMKNGTEPEAMRFRAGGWVHAHGVKDGQKYILISTKYRGVGGFEFTVKYDETEMIWKKIAPSALIEIMLLKQTVANLRRDVDALKK